MNLLKTIRNFFDRGIKKGDTVWTVEKSILGKRKIMQWTVVNSKTPKIGVYRTYKEALNVLNDGDDLDTKGNK